MQPRPDDNVLYSFKGGMDGANPYDALLERNGTLYGTTYSAGRHGCTNGLGCGTRQALGNELGAPAASTGAVGSATGTPIGDMAALGGTEAAEPAAPNVPFR